MIGTTLLPLPLNAPKGVTNTDMIRGSFGGMSCGIVIFPSPFESTQWIGFLHVIEPL